MLPFSKPNHLAQVIDHQKSAARTLPRHLTQKCLELNALTSEIKVLLDNCLPVEILNTLWVGKYENGNLTLSVQSQTAANHLRYQSINLVNILREQSLTFNQLNYINIIVTHYTSKNHSNNSQQYMRNAVPSNSTDLCSENQYGDNQYSKNHPNRTNNSSESYSKRGLSESARRTIAHTAKHVITDERLKRSLERLAKR